MRQLLTAKVSTYPLDQLSDHQHAGRFDNRPLAMHPMRFNAVQPRTLDRQSKYDNPDSSALLDLAIALFDPVSDLLALMPSRIVPDWQQRLLTFCVQLLTTPLQKRLSHLTHWASIHKTQPDLINVGAQQPIAGNRFRVRLIHVGDQFMEA